jgi:hypothetical protein
MVFIYNFLTLTVLPQDAMQLNYFDALMSHGMTIFMHMGNDLCTN